MCYVFLKKTEIEALGTPEVDALSSPATSIWAADRILSVFDHFGMNEIDHIRRETLLALSGATSVDDLWRALRDVFAARMPVSRITLFLGHIGMRSARLVYTHPRIQSPQKYFEARGLNNPFSDYIEANPGVPCYRFSDVLPSMEAFRKSDFYLNFALTEGWLYGMSGLTWLGDELMGMYSLYRSEEQGDFTDTEVEAMLDVHPFIAVAIDRVRRLHRELQYRRVLEEFNRSLPVGLLLINWEDELVYANNEAVRLCADWNEGPGASRQFNTRIIFQLPKPIKEACAELRELISDTATNLDWVHSNSERELTHSATGIRAKVRSVRLTGTNVARPGFLATLEGELGDIPAEPGSMHTERMIILSRLTEAEREIAVLIGEGLSNKEIADKLGKSVLTIKTQVSSIFQKLNLRSRARLIALLH